MPNNSREHNSVVTSGNGDFSEALRTTGVRESVSEEAKTPSPSGKMREAIHGAFNGINLPQGESISPEETFAHSEMKPTLGVVLHQFIDAVAATLRTVANPVERRAHVLQLAFALMIFLSACSPVTGETFGVNLDTEDEVVSVDTSEAAEDLTEAILATTESGAAAPDPDPTATPVPIRDVKATVEAAVAKQQAAEAAQATVEASQPEQVLFYTKEPLRVAPNDGAAQEGLTTAFSPLEVTGKMVSSVDGQSIVWLRVMVDGQELFVRATQINSNFSLESSTAALLTPEEFGVGGEASTSTQEAQGPQTILTTGETFYAGPSAEAGILSLPAGTELVVAGQTDVEGATWYALQSGSEMFWAPADNFPNVDNSSIDAITWVTPEEPVQEQVETQVTPEPPAPEPTPEAISLRDQRVSMLEGAGIETNQMSEEQILLAYLERVGFEGKLGEITLQEKAELAENRHKAAFTRGTDRTLMFAQIPVGPGKSIGESKPIKFYQLDENNQPVEVHEESFAYALTGEFVAAVTNPNGGYDIVLKVPSDEDPSGSTPVLADFKMGGTETPVGSFAWGGSFTNGGPFSSPERDNADPLTVVRLQSEEFQGKRPTAEEFIESVQPGVLMSVRTPNALEGAEWVNPSAEQQRLYAYGPNDWVQRDGYGLNMVLLELLKDPVTDEILGIVPAVTEAIVFDKRLN